MFRSRTLFSMLAVFVLASVVVLAQNPHFRRSPTVSDIGTTLTVSGSLTGLGFGDLNIFLDTLGTATTICTSPGGGSDAPGQNPSLPVDPSGSVTVSAQKNGNATFSVATEEVEDPTPAQAGCQNNNWTARIDEITFSDALITVCQFGEVVLTRCVLGDCVGLSPHSCPSN